MRRSPLLAAAASVPLLLGALAAAPDAQAQPAAAPARAPADVTNARALVNAATARMRALRAQVDAIPVRASYCNSNEKTPAARRLEQLGAQAVAMVADYDALKAEVTALEQGLMNRSLGEHGWDMIDGQRWSASDGARKGLMNALDAKSQALRTAPIVPCNQPPQPMEDAPPEDSDPPPPPPPAVALPPAPAFEPVDAPVVPPGPVCPEEKRALIDALIAALGRTSNNVERVRLHLLAVDEARAAGGDAAALQRMKSEGEAEFERRVAEHDRVNAELQRAFALETKPCPPATEVGLLDDPAVDGGVGVVTVGTGWLALPQVGIGFQRAGGGSETFAGLSPDEVRYHTMAMVLYPLAWRSWVLSGGLFHGRGDARSSGEVPDGGDVDTGFVYTAESPGGGSGVNFGNRGLDWSHSTDVTLTAAKIKMTLATGGPVAWYLFGEMLRASREHQAQASREIFGELLMQEREQDLVDEIFTLGAGVTYGGNMSDRVEVGGWTAAGATYRKSRLDSWERITCALCGPADQSFVIQIDDEDDGPGLMLQTGVYLSYALTRRLALVAGADATWVSEVGAISNPVSGDDIFLRGRQTELTEDEAASWNVGVGIKWNF